ncbi:MAG: hypothetical protein AAFO70_06770 [Pseudomonadota bacterium]
MSETRNDGPWLVHFVSRMESESARRSIVIRLGVACLILLALDLTGIRAATIDAERWFGVYAVIGFVTLAFIVTAAKLLKRLLSRPDDYYGASEIDLDGEQSAQTSSGEYGDG